MIHAVHNVNPSALVLVLALYPDARGAFVKPEALDKISAINAKVEEGISREPNTAFVDFTFPTGQEVFQTSHPGHPNCRGDRIMATRVLEVLYEKHVLARSLALPQGENATTCLAATACAEITDTACCQAAALC